MKAAVFLYVFFFAIDYAFGDGNDAYQQNDYESALEYYQNEIEAKGPNAALLYNLGNTFYRLGNYGSAIYNYERALLLEPRSSDIKANLNLARKAATAFDESNQPRSWLRPLYWFSYNEWLIGLAVCLFALAALSLLSAFQLTRKIPISLKWPVALVSIVIVVANSALLIRHSETKRAIVVSENAKVRLSPFESADVKATLKSGQAVQIEQVHEEILSNQKRLGFER